MRAEHTRRRKKRAAPRVQRGRAPFVRATTVRQALRTRALTLKSGRRLKVVQGAGIHHVADHEAPDRLVLGGLAHAVRAVNQVRVAAPVAVAPIISPLLRHLERSSLHRKRQARRTGKKREVEANAPDWVKCTPLPYRCQLAREQLAKAAVSLEAGMGRSRKKPLVRDGMGRLK